MKKLYNDIVKSYPKQSLISFGEVAEHFGLRPDTLLRKVQSGEIQLPIFRMDPYSQKSEIKVSVQDFASYAQHVYDLQVKPQKQAWLKEVS